MTFITLIAPIYVNVKQYGATGNGTTDDTAAIVAAIASLPTITIYANPITSTGASATYHQGTIFFPAGVYKIGSSVDIGNIGPFVSIIGAGSNCVTLSYYGSGDCLRLFNGVLPAVGFDTLAAWAAKFDGFVLDGTHAGAGARGFHYGDTEGGVLGPDLHIRNFNGAGSIGLYLDSQVSWCENNWAHVNFFNCTNAVIMDASVQTNPYTWSFEYNRFWFKIYAFANQNGVVLQNGALMQSAEMHIMGNFALHSTAQTSACLTIKGQFTGPGGFTPHAAIIASRLDIQVESDPVFTNSGSNGAQTIQFGDPTLNGVFNCTGVMNFQNTWVASNWSLASSFALGTFTYSGQILGDANIAPASLNGALSMAGALIYGANTLFQNGGITLGQGDFANVVLNQNLTLNMAGNTAGPQRKTFIIQQAASGGPYTVTWPKPASPSVGSPAIYWAGGTAPVMTTTASAVDVYALETIDGIHWYGRSIQHAS